jgi:hypothetical protein
MHALDGSWDTSTHQACKFNQIAMPGNIDQGRSAHTTAQPILVPKPSSPEKRLKLASAASPWECEGRAAFMQPGVADWNAALCALEGVASRRSSDRRRGHCGGGGDVASGVSYGVLPGAGACPMVPLPCVH